MNDPQKLNRTLSEKYFADAQDRVPGGVLGIRRPYNFVPGEYPIFFESAKGGKVTDVDGNEYIDMLCAYGPIIIGHREEEIDRAVIEQMTNKGFCMSLTQSIQNQLVDRLRELIPSCEKAIPVKTGSDATTLATRIARGYTNKLKILRCGYHGWHDWCVEVKGGVPEKMYEDVHEFEYNNLAQAEELMRQYKGNVAAIIVTPIGHPLGHAVEMPRDGFLEGLKALAEQQGAVLIFDEIRSGFRAHLGGAQKLLGVTPHMSVFGKAMANGYPISCVVGKREIMDVVVQKVFVSSTFFPNSLEIVAALKTMEILERDRVLDVIAERGKKFGAQLEKIIAASGIPCEFSGAPWMPFITFAPDEKKLYKTLRTEFYTRLIRRKVFLQPFHHGYIAYRHSEADLNYVAGAIEETLKELKRFC